MSEPQFPSQEQAPRGGEPLSLAGQHRLATFPTYLGAQQLVDRMSDDGFPVESVRIVGDGIRSVEHVTGRMTKARAAGNAAASGAWFGLLIGLLLGLFTAGPAWWLWVVVVSVVVGAIWGAIFGYVAHWSTRGRRDFSSISSLEAQKYDVYVDPAYATDAARYTATS